jgi:hypothetical protein
MVHRLFAALVAASAQGHDKDGIEKRTPQGCKGFRGLSDERQESSRIGRNGRSRSSRIWCSNAYREPGLPA